MIGAMLKMTLAIAMLACLMAGNAAAAEPDARAFDQFVRSTGEFCASAASRLCYMRAFTFADRDRDQRLDLAEAQSFQTQLRSWSLAHKDELAENDRRWLFAGLLAVQMVGMPAIFRSYDADADGKLTASELAADFKLDDRPLHVLVQDRSAVNWPSLQHRLGPAAMFLENAIPKSG